MPELTEDQYVFLVDGNHILAALKILRSRVEEEVNWTRGPTRVALLALKDLHVMKYLEVIIQSRTMNISLSKK